MSTRAVRRCHVKVTSRGVGLLALLVLLGTPGPAVAHGIFLDSKPKAGETTPLGVSLVELRFNVRIEGAVEAAAFGTIRTGRAAPRRTGEVGRSGAAHGGSPAARAGSGYQALELTVPVRALTRFLLRPTCRRGRAS